MAIFFTGDYYGEHSNLRSVRIESVADEMKLNLIIENVNAVTLKQLETFFNDPDRSKITQEVEELKDEISDLKDEINKLEDKIYDLEEE